MCFNKICPEVVPDLIEEPQLKIQYSDDPFIQYNMMPSDFQERVRSDHWDMKNLIDFYLRQEEFVRDNRKIP